MTPSGQILVMTGVFFAVGTFLFFYARKNAMNVPKKEKLMVQKVFFVCEQDGEAERRVKEGLRGYFEGVPAAKEAFLARVHYGNPNDVAVTLCLKADAGSEKERTKLADGISTIFTKISNGKACMDVMFLTEEQEKELGSLCKPFFKRGEMATGR